MVLYGYSVPLNPKDTANSANGMPRLKCMIMQPQLLELQGKWGPGCWRTSRVKRLKFGPRIPRERVAGQSIGPDSLCSRLSSDKNTRHHHVPQYEVYGLRAKVSLCVRVPVPTWVPDRHPITNDLPYWGQFRQITRDINWLPTPANMVAPPRKGHMLRDISSCKPFLGRV